jgi:DNA-binding NarL/FixJ family response regulator
VREGLCLVLEREGFAVLARAGTAEEGHAAIVAESPDVALVDVDLPDASGVELTRRLLRRDARLGVLLYTGVDDPGSSRRRWPAARAASR